MQEICTYHIEVLADVDEESFNQLSPIHIRVEDVKPNSTQLGVTADQTGLIGLLRYLHHQGYVLMSFMREG